MQPNHQEIDTWFIGIFKRKLFSFIFDYNQFNRVEKPLSGKQIYHGQTSTTHVPNGTEIPLI